MQNFEQCRLKRLISVTYHMYSFCRMLKELKAPQNNSNAWCSQSDRLQMAEDTLSAVRRVRREVVDGMRMLMKAAKDKKSEGNVVGVASAFF